MAVITSIQTVQELQSQIRTQKENIFNEMEKRTTLHFCVGEKEKQGA